MLLSPSSPSGPGALRPVLVLLCAGFLLATGCAAPDRPEGIPTPLPAATLELLRPDTVRQLPLAPGLAYRYLRSVDAPLALHLLEVDLDRCGLGFEVGVPRGAVRGGTGLDPVSRIAGAHPRPVLAAVNGDLFTAEGRPVGPEVSVAGARTTTDRPAIAFRPGSTPWIGSTGVEPGVRVTVPDWPLGEGDGDRAGGVQVVGGFPELLDDGRRVGDLEVSARPGFAASRHPRTAVGIDLDPHTLWIVVADGRQEGYSMGMSLPELTALFETLGVEEALNLDGGGSSVMLFGGAPVSRPSDPTGERAVANALLLVYAPELCRLR